MSESPEAAHHLDLTGTLCPLTVRLAARALDPLPPGTLLEIVGDDPALVIDLPAWCDEAGHRLIGLTRDGRLVRALVERAPHP